MRISRRDLSAFNICVDGTGECLLYAANQLQHYVRQAKKYVLPILTEKKEPCIFLTTGYTGKIDGFSFEAKGKVFTICGNGERGTLYGVYEFLERFIGWRFFSGRACLDGEMSGSFIDAVEKILPPERDEIEDGYTHEENPVVELRDVFGHATVQTDWRAKNKLNGDIWRLRTTPAYQGGAWHMIGEGGHSFDSLLPADKYYDLHPEYYSLVDGKRIGGKDGQWCCTAPGLAHAVFENIQKLIERWGVDEGYVSVSQNDNENFCTCEKCKEAETKIGRGNLLFGLINEIAEKVEKKYPKIKLHTYAYQSTIQDNVIALRKNVSVQYCVRYCHCHALNDPTCKTNAVVLNRLKELGKKCSELLIYDYRSAQMNTFLTLPDFFHYKANMQALVECGMRGLYSENDIWCRNTPCFEELRSYITAKLLWNPYMSDEDLSRHTREFLSAYYGKGWEHILRYIEIWGEAGKNSHLESITGVVADDDGKEIFEKEKNVVCRYGRKEDIVPFCDRLSEQLDLALAMASENEKKRIEMLYVGVRWYKLFNIMDDVMETGTEEEKQAIMKENEKLYQGMKLYCMKYTIFAGMDIEKMYLDFSISPTKWNYWARDVIKFPFKNILKE